MKILVTGGAGYIGSIFVPSLLGAGHEVVVVDNFMYKQSTLNQLCQFDGFTPIKGDVRDMLLMKSLVPKVDAIFPLAAYVGAPLCSQDPIGAESTNHTAILEMLRVVSRDQMIMMPTTNSAYGSGDENNFCTETSPLRPISKYAIDKVEIEKRLMELPNAISFRLATVFGMSPRMRIDLLVNDFVYRAVHDGFVVLFESHFKRNYVHVRDVSDVFCHSLQNFERMKGEIYNVGLSSANVSKWELCEAIKRVVPKFTFVDAPVGKDPDQRNYIVSNEKIESTGFLPQISLETGIRELVKGFAMLRNTRFGNV